MLIPVLLYCALCQVDRSVQVTWQISLKTNEPICIVDMMYASSGTVAVRSNSDQDSVSSDDQAQLSFKERNSRVDIVTMVEKVSKILMIITAVVIVLLIIAGVGVIFWFSPKYKIETPMIIITGEVDETQVKT
ncbi:hypothetical protein RF11_03149 [Thelohanellus kitauei]|uniref:Uncharacterized protein n=1 Tax=Thelohanellus kitauei TaxID=669202 RepID=A0A0C2NM34_THEKT|nr:hypothetical protein RF11_03149 [Thelohanellus kitauei]